MCMYICIYIFIVVGYMVKLEPQLDFIMWANTLYPILTEVNVQYFLAQLLHICILAVAHYVPVRINL